MIREEAKEPCVHRILFVCSGNICRSPLAEAIMTQLVEAAGAAAQFVIDSAGTHGYHEGEAADPRTRLVGRQHGLEVTSMARPVVDADFDRFDLIVAMDRGHKRELEARAGTRRTASITLMREFDPSSPEIDVADPYYGGASGFEAMYQVLLPACRGLLATLSP